MEEIGEDIVDGGVSGEAKPKFDRRSKKKRTEKKVSDPSAAPRGDAVGQGNGAAGGDEGDGIYPYQPLVDTEEGQEMHLKVYEEQELPGPVLEVELSTIPKDSQGEGYWDDEETQMEVHPPPLEFEDENENEELENNFCMSREESKTLKFNDTETDEALKSLLKTMVEQVEKEVTVAGQQEEGGPRHSSTPLSGKVVAPILKRTLILPNAGDDMGFKKPEVRLSFKEKGKPEDIIEEPLKKSFCPDKGGPGHFCKLCVVPDEAAERIKRALPGLTSDDARDAAFAFLQYMKNERHTERVKDVLKFIHAGEFQYEGRRVKVNKKASHAPALIAPADVDLKTPGWRFKPVPKEQQFETILSLIGKHNGAWEVFEDENCVLSYLCQLTQLLTVLDSHSVKKVMRLDKHKTLQGMLTSFCVEKRWNVRFELINTLELLAMKDSASASVMMKSDLPEDLAKSIVDEFLGLRGGDDERLLSYCNLFAFLLRSGHPLHADQLDNIGSDVVYCLLQLAEKENIPSEISEELRQSAVATIFALNLFFGFDEILSNFVVSTIAVHEDADYLKHTMIHLLLNQKTTQFRNCKVSQPSEWCGMAIKLGLDLMSLPRASGFFLENDLHVLLAGLTIFIPQCEAGDEKRTAALRLARMILRRINHRHPALLKVIEVLRGVLKEKGPESLPDQKISRKIAKEVEASRLVTRM